MRSSLRVKSLNAYWLDIILPNGDDKSPEEPMMFSHPIDGVLYAWELYGRCKVSVRPV